MKCQMVKLIERAQLVLHAFHAFDVFKRDSLYSRVSLRP